MGSVIVSFLPSALLVSARSGCGSPRRGLYASRSGQTSRVGRWSLRRPRLTGARPAVNDDELRAFAALYDIGEVLACKGIAEGVENSNYLVTTERGNFILTLYEKRVAPKDLPFFIALMEHLAQHGVACPTPVRGHDDIALRELCGRPAAIVTFLTGMWPRRIQPLHCAAVGRALAVLHRAGASFNLTRPNDLS